MTEYITAPFNNMRTAKFMLPSIFSIRGIEKQRGTKWMEILQSQLRSLIMSSRKTHFQWWIPKLHSSHVIEKLGRTKSSEKKTKKLAYVTGIAISFFQASGGKHDASAKTCSCICKWLTPRIFLAPDSHSPEKHKMIPVLQANKTITREEWGPPKEEEHPEVVAVEWQIACCPATALLLLLLPFLATQSLEKAWHWE